MRIALALAIAASTTTTAAAAAPAPELFGPGTISGNASDGAPTFTPDGATIYFTRSAATWTVIVESHRAGGGWSEPQVAPFSGEWPDSSPALAPDGSYLVFQSTRPRDPADPKKRGSDLYRVDRGADGRWGAVQKLPAAVNSGASIWKPSIAADGTLYYTSIDAEGHKQLFAAKRTRTGYDAGRPLPFSDGTTGDVDPEIAPDGSFLVFCSDKRLTADAGGKDHLFLVRRTATGWGTPRPVRYAGDDAAGFSTDDEPRLGPDHRTLYFSSDRTVPTVFPRTHAQAEADLRRLEAWDNGASNVWSLSLETWLAEP